MNKRYTQNSHGFAGLLLILLVLVVLFAGPSAQAQFPDVIVTVGDTSAYPGETNTVISIYLVNYQYVIAGFNLWIQLDHLGIAEFQTNPGTSIDTTYWECLSWTVNGNDSTCLDSMPSTPIGNWNLIHIDTNEILIGNHDTTGTLISGWEFVDSRSLGGLGQDINIVAFANMPAGVETPGIQPNETGLLIKILADVMPLANEDPDRVVNLTIQHDFLDHINFSREDGSSIGIAYEPYIDSVCWMCNQWDGPDCVDWGKVSLPPGGDYANCDSLAISPDSAAYIDSTLLILNDGSLTVLLTPDWICGDANGDGSPIIDILDLLYIVGYLFQAGPEPFPLVKADCDGNGSVDVLDILCLVCYLFQGCSPPICLGV